MGGFGDEEQARRLERGLLWVRWIGVGIGAVLVAQPSGGDLPPPPWAAIRTGELLIAVLGLGNLVVHLVLPRLRGVRSVRRLGAAAFALDVSVVLGIIWAFSYHPLDPTWVIALILPLEGSMRYGLWGSLGIMSVASVSELFREISLTHRFPWHAVDLQTVGFKVGIGYIVALVTGVMARALAAEARRAREEAARSAEAAARESRARRELAAFNSVILAGLGEEGLEATLERMAEEIARTLGFDSLAILLCQGDELVAHAVFGIPETFEGARIRIGEGVSGTAAATGLAVSVGDVRTFPGYVEVNPGVRSNLAVPIRTVDGVLGVLDIESLAVDAFDEETVRLAERLADRIAIVVQNAQLRATEHLALERLQQLEQTKSDFLAIVNHELRTPVAAVSGFLHLLARQRERFTLEELDEFLVAADRRTAELAKLVEDLMQAGSVADRSFRVRPQLVAIPALIESSLADLTMDERSRITLDIADDASVWVDPYHVRQIAVRLLDNALKFSRPDGPVRVRAELRDRALRVAVVDRGVGIEPETLPTIFEWFRQGQRSMHRDAEGLGLGLFLVRRLLDALGGEIEVASEPGAGSTFTVTVPVGLAMAPPPEAERAERRLGSRASVSPG